VTNPRSFQLLCGLIRGSRRRRTAENPSVRRSVLRKSCMVVLASLLIVVADIDLPAQVATRKQVDLWRQQMRDALFIPNPLPATSPESYGNFTAVPGVIVEHVSYRTEYGLRIPADVYRPAIPSKGKMPAIIVVNGHGADKSSWYAYYTGVLYARAGAVVLTYDPIGEGERNDDHKVNTGEHDRIIDVPTMGPRMGGLMVTDIMQAVSYLSARPDVDAHRIAVMGFSMGSFISALAGAADPRIHALLLVGGGDLDGPGGYWDSSHAVMCQSGPYKALNLLGDRPAVLFTLNARRGSTFIINGTNDTVVDIPHHEQDFFDALRQRVIQLNGSERGVFTTTFDAGASHRPSWMTRVAAEWLGAQLHFHNWPESSIASLPVNSIKDWAIAVGYSLGKSSSREDRDAGIQAIIGNVPLMDSEQTDVLSPTQWQLRKSEFIYASWVERALADAQATSSKVGGSH
jgi:dienelactone hydrolase